MSAERTSPGLLPGVTNGASTERHWRFPLDRPLFWLLLLALAHVAVRVAISPSVKWDEAEQLLWTQHLALGYGPQPPLYTWLQWGVNLLFGPTVLSLSVLKHALIVLTYVFLWLAAREFLGRRAAWWAAASMLLLPSFGWRTIIDLTHTVLVVCATCAAWWLLLRCVRRPTRFNFIGLGLACACGVLAKYSFVLIAAAMFLAALSVTEVRRAFWRRAFWWLPVTGAVLVLPHAFWVLSHWQLATSLTVSKMAIDPAHGRWLGLWDLVEELAENLALFVLLALAVFGGAWWRRPLAPASDWAVRLFGRFLACVLLALAAMALIGGVTVFKGRWITPMICIAPLAAFVLRPELEQHPRGRIYTLVIVLLALVVLVASALRPWIGGPGRLNFPIAALEQTLLDAGYDRRAPIIASDHMTGGMLRARFPNAPVDTCPALGPDSAGPCVAAAVKRAEAGHQGWLLITCAGDDAPADWWQQASIDLPAPVRTLARTVAEPYPGARTDPAPVARCTFFWQAANSAA